MAVAVAQQKSDERLGSSPRYLALYDDRPAKGRDVLVGRFRLA